MKRGENLYINEMFVRLGQLKQMLDAGLYLNERRNVDGIIEFAFSNVKSTRENASFLSRSISDKTGVPNSIATLVKEVDDYFGGYAYMLDKEKAGVSETLEVHQMLVKIGELRQMFDDKIYEREKIHLDELKSFLFLSKDDALNAARIVRKLIEMRGGDVPGGAEKIAKEIYDYIDSRYILDAIKLFSE